MALDALLAEIDEDARKERAALRDDARERARALMEETEVELTRTRSRALDGVRSDAFRAGQARKAEARTEARQLVFGARAQLLERVRRAAEARVAEAPTDEAYRSSVRRDVASTLDRAPEGRLDFRAPGALLDALRDALEAHDVRVAETEDRGGRGAEDKAGIRIVPDEEVGSGFLVVADEGRVQMDATLDARLRRRWREEAMHVLRELDR